MTGRQLSVPIRCLPGRIFSAASGQAALAASCVAFALIVPGPAIAEQADWPANSARAQELAELCLTMKDMDTEDVSAAARAGNLEHENDPLGRLEQHFDHLHSLYAGHFDWDRVPDASQTARKVLYPLDDPEPMMAFRDADDWLYLVGLNATVRLSLDDLNSNTYTRYTAHSCKIYGKGWISDGEARNILSRILGTDFAGHETTPADILPDDPKTVALGVSSPDQQSEVNLLIESVRGVDAHGPVSMIEISTASTAQPAKGLSTR